MTRQVPISYTLPFACIFDARSARLSTMPGCRNRRITRQRRVGSRLHISAVRRTAPQRDARGIKGTLSTVVAVVISGVYK
jgi:hypothetical protein